MLKIIVSRLGAFASSDFEPYKEMINEAIKEGHTVTNLSGCYLHGDVEDAMGYDICACLNAEECVEKNSYKPGIYRAEIVGYDKPCYAYLWNKGGFARGLIVSTTDCKSIDYAYDCYMKRLEWL